MNILRSKKPTAPLSMLSAAAVSSGALALIALAAIIGPWLLFWSVGALFGVVVPLTLKTWLAAMILLALVRGGSS